MTRSVSSTPRRVLFVSYLFPPVGGVGVHRVTKFVKYLPQFGWECSVLTVANPSTPLVDGSLRRDVPVSTNVVQARTLEPGYGLKAAVGAGEVGRSGIVAAAKRRLKGIARRAVNTVLQPDPQILWRPAALREGKRLLREMPHDAIIATGPPFSSLLLGAALAKASKLPLILDYRDEWGISNAYWENKQHSWFSNMIQKRMQYSAVRAADVLLATTPSSAKELEHTAEAAGSRARSRFIYNGFDPDDFGNSSHHAERIDYGNGVEKCRLAFVGTLWNLNPIGPVVDGVLRLIEQRPDLANQLEIVLAGRRTAEQDAELDRLHDSPVKVVRQPFMAHDEAVRLMHDADSLLLLNADKPETHRIINAKTFEYMAARRPIFVVAPRGDLWDVTAGLPGTIQVSPSDPAAVTDGLVKLVERHAAGLQFDARVWDIARFERKRLAQELSQLLEDVVYRHGIYGENVTPSGHAFERKKHPLADSAGDVDLIRQGGMTS
ncbi:D-inositol-3-phosphate glycosyltransferase [Caulifigura coniformis]|uniref:D-inositol-3-phosphate glycosyltransferase n=1 Tax=Caulifigura coniformis TaxID=2527983 RepID=A0A517SGZ2_9PLAN|nr:glycosyltransferase [Caulifigura coniformis]QDT55393.1 D-inositol-3-phosphate glycosyltransferase [Caulifigura coniformis]